MLKEFKRNVAYPIALILSRLSHKTFEALAQENGEFSGDKLIRSVIDHPTTMQDLVHIAKTIFKGKKISLLFDDTTINKPYSKIIEGTSDNYNSSEKRTIRSLCSVVGMITDGKISIPINHKLWISKEFNTADHKRKWELARDLILEIQQVMPIKLVIADGLYATQEFLDWLIQNNFSFEMRFHSNRVIEKGGVKEQIRYHPALKLKNGRTTRTTTARWKLFKKLYFTAHKRQFANGNFTTVFLVSNIKATSSQHVEIYRRRWVIEILFRTAKQKLGLADCQSRKLERQNAHIFKVFLAYALAQYERTKCRLPNVESAIKSVKERNSIDPNYAIDRFREIFRYA